MKNSKMINGFQMCFHGKICQIIINILSRGFLGGFQDRSLVLVLK